MLSDVKPTAADESHASERPPAPHVADPQAQHVASPSVRVLVIDNYDSFTYNLVDYVSAVGSVETTVIRNDDPHWASADLADFDAVVISPGPGRPDRAADFGICAEVIRDARVPLLGVCLGHQGICHAYGGDVVPAPEPVHGRTSAVRHTGDELFDGIPSPFLAVRYHSLMATRVPAELDVIAHSEDGIVMAVRHPMRPLWGVQFHPESICTEHGRRLLDNFVDLARRHRVKRGPQLTPDTGAPTPTLAEPVPAGTSARVLWRRLDQRTDAETVFDTLYRDADHAFWLDSSLIDSDRGRFSVIGDASGPRARVASADVRRGEVTVVDAHGQHVHRDSFFDWLRDDLAGYRIDPPDLPFDFTLGWVGYLGYELKAECGGESAHESPYPDACLIFADRAIAFDHASGDVYLLALAVDGDERPALDWLDATCQRLARIDAPVASSGPILSGLGPLTLRHTRDAYLDLIDACQREIRAGESYEICLTNMIEVPATLNPWSAYRTLRRHNPSPHAAFLRFADLSVLSASPERFLRIGRDRVAESRPIKGTRGRGASPAADERLRTELSRSVKDRAENLMIVDLVRNDLGATAEAGTITVDRLFDIETYSNVHQLVSTIRSRIRADASPVDCVRAAFPGGSMTGAPKVRTMSILDSLESGARGVYSGAIGYFSLSGAVDLSITIRTVVATPGLMTYGVGGAITALSDPDAEFDETMVKAAGFLSLIDLAISAGL